MSEPSRGSAPAPSYVHRGGETPLIGLPIGRFFRDAAARFAGSEAVVSIHQGVRLTYAELYGRVDAVARGLVGLGIGRGDRLAIWSTNNVEWVLVQMAAARVGAVLVNLNPAYRTHELEQALKTVGVSALIVIPAFRTSRYVEMVLEVFPEAARLDPDAFADTHRPEVGHLIVFDPECPDRTERPARAFLPWREFLDRGRRVREEEMRGRCADPEPDDPINIQFTSGTTGAPKAVVLTHHNILNNAWFVGDVMRFTEADRLCVPVPFYHCFGMVLANLLCLVRGATVVIPTPHFDAGAVLAAIERERCTAVYGVPSMFIAAMAHPEFRGRDLSSLRTGIMGGAPCPEELVHRIIDEMGCHEMLVAYGQTESSPITHVTRPDDPIEKRTRSVGTNLPHQEVKLVDPDTGAVVPIGAAGEICFRGYHVMHGYEHDEAATRRAIDAAGWLHSGDLGILDSDGYLRITGRLKDMIIRGGENVYPAEIEDFYYRHPKVAEIAVIGVPDPVLGEEIVACIRLREGVTADPEEFREHARGRIAHYKIPKHVVIVDDFPRTATGKVQKFRIREQVARTLEAREPEDAGPGTTTPECDEPGRRARRSRPPSNGRTRRHLTP